MPKAKKRASSDGENVRTEPMDVIASESLADYIPDKLRTKLAKHAAKVAKVAVRYLPADAATLSSWRTAPGTYRTPVGEADAETLGVKILELAIAHYRRSEDKPQRYQAVITLEADDGSTPPPIHCSFELEAGLEGQVYAVDASEHQAPTEASLLRDLVLRLESQNKILHDALANERREHREDMKQLHATNVAIVHELGGVAKGLGGMVAGVTEGLTAAATIQRETAGEAYKIKKLELEHEREIAEHAQAQQVRQMGLDALKQYGPLILGHVLKLEPEQVAQIMAASNTGGGKPAAMLTAEAQAWTPPPKPIVDLDVPDEQLQLDGILSRWFACLTDDQERAARATVGPQLYDQIRNATSNGPAAATSAVRKLNAEVRKLNGSQRVDLIKSINSAIGNENALWFLSIMKRAGGLDGDDS